jgi:hypothetical protein
MGGPCVTYGRKRNTYRVLVRRLEVKRPLEDLSVDVG